MRQSIARIGSVRILTRLAPALLVIGLATSACGSSDSDGADGAGLSSDKIAAAAASAKEAETAPTQITQTVPLSKAPPKGKAVVFIQGPDANSVEQFAGIQEAATSVGWTSTSIKFNPTDLSTLNAALLQALSGGADYVVESGIPESQLSKSTVAKFASAGVPIVVIDSTPVPSTDTLLGLSGGVNSRVQAGAKLADWFTADSEGKGRAVIVNITAYPTLTLFADSFAKGVATSCPACQVQTNKETFESLLSGKLITNVISTLRADRSIKYAVFDNSIEITGVDAALKAAGLDDVEVIGHGIDPVSAKSIKQGQASAFVAYNFRFGAWEAIDVALRHSVGDETADTDVVTPFQLITKENVDQLPDNAIFRDPADSLQQFEKLWLVDGAS